MRHFCADCGSQLTFRMTDDPQQVSINVPTLDRPEALPPRMHIFCESRLPWIEIADDLPRYDQAGPELGS